MSTAVSIPQLPTLTVDEERDLFTRLAAGDKTVRDRLVRSNQGMVHMIVKKWCKDPGSHDYDDILANGQLGLVKAIDNFDVSRGFRFSTFAFPYIERYVKMQRDDLNDQLGVARTQHHARWRMKRLIIDAVREDDPVAAVWAVCKRESVSPQRIYRLIMALDSRPRRLDAPIVVEDGEGTVYGDLLPAAAPSPEEMLMHAQEHSVIRRSVREAVKQLPPREAHIARMRILRDGDEDESKLTEIGLDFNVTRERARQIEAGAKKKLREVLSRFSGPAEKKYHLKSFTDEEYVHLLIDRLRPRAKVAAPSTKVSPTPMKSVIPGVREFRRQLIIEKATEMFPGGVVMPAGHTADIVNKVLEACVSGCNEKNVSPPKYGIVYRTLLAMARDVAPPKAEERGLTVVREFDPSDVVTEALRARQAFEDAKEALRREREKLAGRLDEIDRILAETIVGQPKVTKKTPQKAPKQARQARVPTVADDDSEPKFRRENTVPERVWITLKASKRALSRAEVIHAVRVERPGQKDVNIDMALRSLMKRGFVRREQRDDTTWWSIAVG